MSYLFSVKATTKADLGVKIQEALAQVVSSQPVHGADAGQTLTAAWSIFSLLPDDPTRDIAASISGSILRSDAGVQSVSLNMNFGFATRD